MTDIRELDARTVEQIAAGEVVERPASVVKELVENAVDADASRIDVTVEEGGREGIRVGDDGVGMSREDVQRAVREHTTSKIDDVADLEAGVSTLGFRGEALHAVGAVSRLTITTRPRDGEVGTELLVEGGDVSDVGPAGRPPGTTVSVDDLFFNVPARRKYLERASTEFAHVNRVVTGYALANPDVAVSLTHGDRETFATTGQGDLRETVMAVYGSEVARAMIDVRAGDPAAAGEAGRLPAAVAGSGSADGAAGGATDDDGITTTDLPEGPLDAVAGLVSHPETNRAGREYLSTYVNGRYVRSGAVREAIVEAYGRQLAADRYPFAVLFLALDPASVDVNVHPRKREVRFADEEAVREQVEAAVEAALLDAGLVRSGAPRGKSAPDQTTIDPQRTDDPDGPTLDEQEGGANEHAERTAGDDGVESAGSVDRDQGATGENDEGEGAADADPTADADEGTDADAADGGGIGAIDADSIRPTGSTGAADADAGGESAADAADETDRTAASETSDATGSSPAGESGASSPAEEPPGGESTSDVGSDRTAGADGRKFSGGHSQARLGDDGPDDALAEEYDSLPPMRILGQYRDTYVVAETDAGLVLIDQHAADERINYERLRAAFDEETTTQALASPVEVELTAREAALFEERSDALANLGFHAERTGERTVSVRTVPGLLADAAGPELIRDVLAATVDGDAAASSTVEAAASDLLADLACYPSVTGNTSLAEGSIRELLAALDDCENPFACPHGRPVVVRFDDDEVEARFERDYPGHGERRD